MGGQGPRLAFECSNLRESPQRRVTPLIIPYCSCNKNSTPCHGYRGMTYPPTWTLTVHLYSPSLPCCSLHSSPMRLPAVFSTSGSCTGLEQAIASLCLAASCACLATQLKQHFLWETFPDLQTKVGLSPTPNPHGNSLALWPSA